MDENHSAELNRTAAFRDTPMGDLRGRCRAFLALGTAVPLAQLYEQHADDCARSAEQTEDPRRRAFADEWRRDAQKLRQRATATKGG
jgi:hypothetical protein